MIICITFMIENHMRAFLYSVITDQVHGFIPGFIRIILTGLACFYGAVIRLRLFLYQRGLIRKKRLDKPVMSIGNITWGGVGKTPIVQWLVEVLKEKGVKPVILTRGYAGQGCGACANDEVMMLQEALENVPVVVGENRFRGAQKILKRYPADIFVMDDGFQHLALERQLDIVAIDVTNPFGNGKLIPRGILREPVSSLSRADLFILTKTDFGRSRAEEITQKLKTVHPRVPIIETIHQAECLKDFDNKIYPFGCIAGKSIGAFCGIGDPASFEEMLNSLKAEVEERFFFEDHHAYTTQDISRLVEGCHARGIHILVTTAKDAVKLKDMRAYFFDIQVLILEIKIMVTKGKDEILSRINRLL